MVTDWLRNPDVLRLLPLVAAFACALLLAATRRIMPPEKPRWRLVRALIIVAAMIATYAVLYAALGRWMGLQLTPPMKWADEAWLGTVARVLSGAVFFGWLIPWGIEGRSLREMGWTTRKAGRYLVGGAIGGLALALLRPPASLPPELQGVVGESGTSALGALLAAPPALVWALALGFLFSGWTEENVFRGHLLPSLREVGLSGRAANVTQAVVFAAMHVPSLVALLAARQADHGTAGVIAAAAMAIAWWFLWGVLFGWLRMRFGSILPGFALHGTHNFIITARVWAPMLAIMQSLSS